MAVVLQPIVSERDGHDFTGKVLPLVQRVSSGINPGNGAKKRPTCLAPSLIFDLQIFYAAFLPDFVPNLR